MRIFYLSCNYNSHQSRMKLKGRDDFDLVFFPTYVFTQHFWFWFFFVNPNIYHTHRDDKYIRKNHGINTFFPETENYVLDINGPVKINHSEIAMAIKNCSIPSTFNSSGFIIIRTGLIINFSVSFNISSSLWKHFGYELIPISILEKYPNNINWTYLSQNTGTYKINYSFFKEKMDNNF